MRLAEHVQAVIDEREHWLRELPANMPSWAMDAWIAQKDGLVTAVAKCDEELSEAVALLRAHGLVP